MPHERVPPSPRRRLLPDLLCTAAVAAAITVGLAGPGVVRGSPGLAAAAAERPAAADTDEVTLRLQSEPVAVQRADTLMYQDSLVEPLVVRSVNGVLSATLDVTLQNLPVTHASGTVSLPLRAYSLVATTDPAYGPNDPRFTPRFPGPTFRVRPGDLVQITLRNKLPPPTTAADSNANCMNYPAAQPGASPQDEYQDCFHGPNYTNIHYHGMHVTPDSIRVVTGDSSTTFVGDDVLLTIPPGSSIQYNFRIPTNQSPGTHWYHPHKHGSVAIQVVNGMAGAFIVEDPARGLDSLTRAYNIREHLIAFQQIDTAVGLIHGTTVADKLPPLVNGQNYPVIYMAPGEVQRWRIVNENITRNTKTLEFRFENRPGQEPRVWDIARDGVQFAPANYSPQSDSVLQMGPGQRLDVFVQAPTTPGTHYFQVSHMPGASQGTREPVLPLEVVNPASARPGARVNTTATAAANAAADRQQVSDPDAFLLFRVVVDPSRRNPSRGRPTALPELPPFLRGRLAPARDTAVIVFTDSQFGAPTQFWLGSVGTPHQRFNDTVVFVPTSARGDSLPMLLDSTQTWKIVNNSMNGNQQINHPFHIHINPFQVNRVVAPNPKDPFQPLYAELNRAASRNQMPIWLDVIPLPWPAVDSAGVPIPNSAYVVITQRYDDFEGCPDGSCGPATGNFVMHCHILGHEERGMMQVLQVREAGQPLTRPRGHGTHYPAPGSRRGTGQGGGQGTGQGNGQGGGGGGGQPPQAQPPGEHQH